MAILMGSLTALGVLCIAAGAYRIGFRRGHDRGCAVANEWRDSAVAIMNAKADNAETLKAIAAAYQRRAEAMGRMLRSLGYSVQEVEDPAAGTFKYRAQMVQPAQRLPLGPSMS